MNDASAVPTPATPDVCTLALLVDGTEISGEFHVLSVEVARELNRIPLATIELRDGDAAQATFPASNADHFIPGRKIEIQLGYRSSNETVFRGIVVRQGIRIRKNASLLVVECRDEAVRMTCGTRSHVFASGRDSDIIEDVIGAYGLATEIEATTARLEEIVQFDASDWDFVLCRAEANGQVVIIEDGKARVVRPATGEEPVIDLRYGATLIELDAEIDARWQSERVTATSWNDADQALAEAEASEPAASAGGNLAPADLAKAVGAQTKSIRHGGALNAAELQAWADARLQRERLAKVRGRARFQGFAGVLPGKVISLSGVGERFNGRMYVSGVRHSVVDGNWETNVQFGLSPRLFAEAYALRPPPAAGLLPAARGLQIGVVTALEGDPGNGERIRLRLPIVDNQDEGIWARIATLDAGNRRGTYFRPEIGDEVVVGFLDSDPRHPVVLGMCHSSARPAPEPPADANPRKGYTSREKMQLRFDDEKKEILVETPAGNRMRWSEDEGAIVIEDQNGNRIRLDDSGISIESSKDLVLKAAGDVTLKGLNVTLDAGTAFKASASGNAEVSAANATVAGSATAVLRGGLVRIN
ncbi:type VI secretion system tip protein VgrG [Cupriavidus necator]|uniref:type VI secretion system tip protein VgrG n=1 Tax=Cupriavidus necator TaxID=106590 RepID=UPI0039C1C76A